MMEFLIVTGLSGAGKTNAANFLEDLDFYCVDNMPTVLLLPFAEFCVASRGRFEKVALVTDCRAQENFDALFQAMDALRERDCICRILFMDAADDVIVRRYKESRRRHPLSQRGLSMLETVRRERQLIQPVRDRADYIIDTSRTTLGQLHNEICRLFVEGGKHVLPVNVMSFGYKYGLPLEADIVFDVRFLPNPYYVEELKPLSGLDQPVSDFVMGLKDAQTFLIKLTDLADFLLPLYQEEGKQSLTIGIGCTGGRHRSVALARALTEHLINGGHNARLINRDLGKVNDQ